MIGSFTIHFLVNLSTWRLSMTTADTAITSFMADLTKRPRRNRKSHAIRSLVQETRLHPNHLIAPLFVLEGTNQRQEIPSMPGVFRMSIDLLIKEIESLYRLGICAVDLFTFVPSEKKDRWGSEAVRTGNLLQKALIAIKRDSRDMRNGRYCIRSIYRPWA